MPEAMQGGYVGQRGRSWHQSSVGLATAVGVSGSIWLGWRCGAAVAVGWMFVARTRRWSVAALLLVCCATGAWRSACEWSSAHLRLPAACSGWVNVIEGADRNGTMVVQRLGQRVEVRTRSSDTRLRSTSPGSRVWVEGECTSVSTRRLLVRHVVGRMHLRWFGVVLHGGKFDDALGGLHHALHRAAVGSMAPEVASLFTGLVIGDDADEPAWLSEAFRRSGLAHLQAVSGENVAFVLVVLRPLLVRLRPVGRLCCTLGALAGFVFLTGAQPSVLRAAAMASVAAVAFLTGRQVDPVRSLCWCVVGLELIDPFLVWSAGFWLSVGATAGIVSCASWLKARIGGPAWLAMPLAVTVSAQLGTMVPSLLVFHRVPVVGVVANLVAVPVAGMVMLLGLPVALTIGWSSGLSGSWLGHVLMWPCAVGTRWVLDVARVASAVEPSGRGEVIAWMLLALTLGGWLVARRRSVPI